MKYQYYFMKPDNHSFVLPKEFDVVEKVNQFMQGSGLEPIREIPLIDNGKLIGVLILLASRNDNNEEYIMMSEPEEE